MNNLIKKAGPLRIALVLFVLLALFILIVEKPGSASIDRKEGNQPLFFPRLDLEQVTHVEITLPTEKAPIELRRGAEGWMVNEKNANQEKMKTFLDAVYLLRKEALVSKNSEKQSFYEVDSLLGTHITLWSNSKERANFYLGDPPFARLVQYVRLEGDNEVWEAIPLVPFVDPPSL